VFLTVAIVFILAVGFGLLFTRTARSLGERLGLHDAPDGRRKTQARPVAVVGGLALLAAVPTALGVAALLLPEVAREFAGWGAKWAAVAAACVVLAAVGAVDDRRNLRARYKLLGQLLAVAVLIVGGGYLIREVSAFGVTVPLGGLAVPFTLFWFVFAINALNLLDGMDGMLGGVGVVLFLGLAAMAGVVGSGFAVLVSAAAAGGLVGFLRYNLPPATVYLGDCGSMLIGLTVGALAMDASLKGPTFAVLAPLALLVLPALDTTAAVVRRQLTGRGLAVADRGHLHHVLLRHGFSIPRVLLIVGGFGLLAAGGAVLSAYKKNDLIAVVAAVVVVATLIVYGLFGAAELRLIRARAGSALRKAAGGRGVDLEVRLQGTHAWGDVWRGIVHDAQSLDLTAVSLDVNAPAWHEGYHRRWQRAGAADDPLTVWRVELPLVAGGQVVGRLVVRGSRADGCMAEKLAALSAVVRETERRLAASLPTGRPLPTSVVDHTPLPAESERIPPAVPV